MLQYVFMQKSLFIGVLLGIVVPLIGVNVVLRRLSMVGDALSHTSLAGVAAGLIAGINPVAGASVACVAGALCIEGIRMRFKEQSELAVAIVLAAGIGTAGVLSGFVPNSASFNSFLFGSILTVTDEEVAFVTVVSLVALAFCLIFRRSLLLSSYDESQARIAGVRLGALNIAFVLLVALTVAIAARSVGSLMVSSMMVVPVACALQLAHSWRSINLIAAGIGVSSTLIGLTISFYAGLKPGGTIVLIAIALLLLIFLYKGIRHLIVRRLP